MVLWWLYVCCWSGAWAWVRHGKWLVQLKRMCCSVFMLWKLNSDGTEDLLCSQFPVYQSIRPQNWPVTILLTKILSFSGMFAKGGSCGCVMSVSLPFHLKNILYEPSILECLCRWDSVATLQHLIPVSCKRFHSPPKCLTTHFHVMPRLRMNGVLPPFCLIWLSGVDRDNCAS